MPVVNVVICPNCKGPADIKMRSINICQNCGGELTGDEEMYVEAGGDGSAPAADVLKQNNDDDTRPNHNPPDCVGFCLECEYGPGSPVPNFD